MPHISELKTGDQIQLWLNANVALELTTDAKKHVSYQPPRRISPRTKPNAFTQFWGLVQGNNAISKIITLYMQPFHGAMQIPTGQSAVSELHYSTFQRVRLVSRFHHEPRAIDMARPTDHSPLSNTRYHPYRTSIDVRLR